MSSVRQQGSGHLGTTDLVESFIPEHSIIQRKQGLMDIVGLCLQ